MHRNAVINFVLLLLAILFIDHLGRGIPQVIGVVLAIILVLRLVLAARKSKKSKEDELKKW